MQNQETAAKIENIRKKWNFEQAKELMDLPFNDLLFKAQTIHRQNFDPNKIQLSTLLSIKTGGCPENCKYCPQSAHYDAGVEKSELMDKDEIVKIAKKAKENGASRFCMGAAWRKLADRDVEKVSEIIKAVKDEDIETCLTVGMITDSQAKDLKKAGLDYYNHNIDTSREFYDKIISTRNFDDRLQTLENVSNNNINVCSGGIIGMGESLDDRVKMLITLANLKTQPGSVPINMLQAVDGTPLEDQKQVDVFEFIRVIALARIMIPKAYVRLSAGRKSLSREAHSMCFLAGANSIFYGDTLLTQDNPEIKADQDLMQELKITAS